MSSPAEKAEEKILAKLAAVPDLTTFVSKLRELTTEAADEILKNPNNINAAGGYIDRWYTSYAAFCADTSETAFLAARYGYAVETLVTAKIERNENQIKDSLNDAYVAYQVSHGHTRPDIVVMNQNGTERAWYDITSDSQKGHIDNKVGASWRNSIFAQEVYYPQLNIGALKVSLGATDAEKREIENRIKAAKQLEMKIANGLNGLIQACHDSMPAAIVNNKSEKRKHIETWLYRTFKGNIEAGLPSLVSTHEKLEPAVTKSLLAHVQKKLGRDWFSTFGYDAEHKTGRDAHNAMLIIDLFA